MRFINFEIFYIFPLNFCIQYNKTLQINNKKQPLILLLTSELQAMSDIPLNSSTALDTSKHSLNNSGSKHKFSFPKAERFGSSRKNILCDSIYQIPTTRNIRTTSFGYGNKTIGLRIDKNIPQPATYTLSSEFDEKKKGSSFGEGRQKLLLGGPLRQSILKKFVPGPGNYQSAYSTLEVPTISLKSRIIDKSLDYLKKIPGPGAYNHEQIGTTKYYVSSKHQYTGGTKISPRAKLDPINRSVSVGPGSYESKSVQLNSEGRYFLSRFQNSKTRVFSKSKRQQLINKNQLYTPGPGNYGSFSTFG